MSSKGYPDEEKSSGSKRDDDEEDFAAEGKQAEVISPPIKIDILEIEINPPRPVRISEGLDLKIRFELDRDAVAAFWRIKFLVDSSYKRIIKILGETSVEDYPDGDSEMIFSADSIDISGIPESTLTNSGLLMASFIVDGEEIASVNMVVNVFGRDGELFREVLSPLE